MLMILAIDNESSSFVQEHWGSSLDVYSPTFVELWLELVWGATSSKRSPQKIWLPRLRLHPTTTKWFGIMRSSRTKRRARGVR